ncbi:MAG: hypothetical protein U1E22_10120 [Coriobacteriia bacterium]|nr:hypothetical protein [Coriobacteriia bacterium]
MVRAIPSMDSPRWSLARRNRNPMDSINICGGWGAAAACGEIGSVVTGVLIEAELGWQQPSHKKAL